MTQSRYLLVEVVTRALPQITGRYSNRFLKHAFYRGPLAATRLYCANKVLNGLANHSACFCLSYSHARNQDLAETSFGAQYPVGWLRPGTGCHLRGMNEHYYICTYMPPPSKGCKTLDRSAGVSASAHVDGHGSRTYPNQAISWDLL